MRTKKPWQVDAALERKGEVGDEGASAFDAELAEIDAVPARGEAALTKRPRPQACRGIGTRLYLISTGRGCAAEGMACPAEPVRSFAADAVGCCRTDAWNTLEVLQPT